jgi:endonuclease/exonuclease/phosphatase family metal-dependent hydrolase
LTPEQEAQLQSLETELAIADKQLRLAQVKKQIAETELDIIGLQQTLQQQLETTAISQI